ncbi:MAG: hypothetical protein VKL39_18750, partial [Leptolyngbyaceae bacterium]|nr:hypothetical protein [Leptolyngbyaceae bacterium]
MIDNTILQRAKDGKADAIAALMNHSLNPKGIHATAERAGDRLLVNLETDALPDQALLTKFVHQGVRNLKLATVETIMVSGRVKGSDRPAWTSTIYLDAYPDDTHPQATTSEAVSSSSVASTLEPSMGTNVGGKRAGVMPPPPPPPLSRPPVPPPPPPPPEMRQPETLQPEEPNDALGQESPGRVTSNGDLNLGDSTSKDSVTSETPDASSNAGFVTRDSVDHLEDAPLDSVGSVATPAYDYDVYAEDQFLSDDEG